MALKVWCSACARRSTAREDTGGTPTLRGGSGTIRGAWTAPRRADVPVRLLLRVVVLSL
jgi:hypothetical protein